MDEKREKLFKGVSPTQIARSMGISRGTVCNAHPSELRAVPISQDFARAAEDPRASLN